jgi:hypothetical protein
LFVEPDEQAEPKLSQATAFAPDEAFRVARARFGDAGVRVPARTAAADLRLWRGLAQRLFTALCHNPNLENASTISIPKPAEAEWSALAEGAPPMKGLEYLNGAVLARLWDELDAHVHAAIAQTPAGRWRI